MTEQPFLRQRLVEPGPVGRVKEGRFHPAREGASWTS
jgi:hypothetical protein